MQQVKEVNVKNLPVVGSIIISSKLKDKIDYLHRKVGKIEWSGILLYKLSSGVISKMNNLVFKAVDVYPMDIGSSANTTFEYTPDTVVNMYDKVDNSLEMSIGLCHSHHNMNSFISGTDFKEIQNNAGNYNYYISLVVSFDENYVCKIAFPSKTIVKKTSTIRNEKGKYVTIKLEEEEESLLLGDLNVVFEQDNKLDKWFVERVDTIKKEKVEKEKKITTTVYTPNKGSWERDAGNKWETYPTNPYKQYPMAPSEVFPKPSFESTFNKPVVKQTDRVLNKTELFLMGILGEDVSDFTTNEFFYSDLQETIKVVSEWERVDLRYFEDLVEDNIIDAFNILYNDTEITEFDNKLRAVNVLLSTYNSTKNIRQINNLISNVIKQYDTSTV